ncbi:MAG: flagellar brake protein [Bacillus sp. (in: Bacteria)]|nr:flagellar brake protein [Bacillus sp. (in: firmicutes)]MCM1425973.1 flagellar brake protein [Eubacterium sp.]
MEIILSKFIEPGNRIELQKVRRLRDDDDAKRKVYNSQLIDIISDDRIEISMPMEKTKLILLPIGGEYDLYFFTTNGLYQCYARVVDRYKTNNMFMVQLDLTSNLRKHQRREYYRFSCALEMNSRPLEKEEVRAIEKDSEQLQSEILVPELPLQRSVIADISGGGLRFVAEYAYEVDSLILCKYSLWMEGETKEYTLYGRVLEVKPIENRPGFYEHRVQYVHMDKDNREEIIKYIFNEERKTLKMINEEML